LVKAPTTNCPRCEALHPFRPQRRPLDEKLIEIYVRCTSCGHTVVLRRSTAEIERLRKLKLRLEARARYVRKRNGVVDTTTANQLERVKVKLRALNNEITN